MYYIVSCNKKYKYITRVNQDEEMNNVSNGWRVITNCEYLSLKYSKGWKVEEWDPKRLRYVEVENGRRK